MACIQQTTVKECVVAKHAQEEWDKLLRRKERTNCRHADRESGRQEGGIPHLAGTPMSAWISQKQSE